MSPGSKYATTYLRHSFNIADLSQITGQLNLKLRRDDGVIVYVNGSRVGVTNVNAAATYSTYASSEIADADENNFVTFQVDKSLLNNGTNVIAVELHQFNHAGQDLGFDLELSGNLVSAGGRPAGSNIADSFLFKDDQVFIAPFEGDMALPLGPITMTVSVADRAGNVTTRQKSFNVSVQANQAPEADFTVSAGTSPQSFKLSAVGSSDPDGTVTRYEWYFPGGQTALGKDVTWSAPGAGIYEVELYVWDDKGGVAEHEADLTVAGVVDRQIFYNQSVFDGNDPSASIADDGAIATDKRPLLPGQAATFANYTSYSRGINGIMIDIAGLTRTSTLGDFEFRIGNGDNPSLWAAAPAPASIAVRDEAGSRESGRVTIIWPDDAIRNQWLQVTVKTALTGQATPDVFYFGNAVGEAGNGADAVVNASDEIAARNNPRTFINPAPVDWFYDFNRDGFVNAADQIIARSNASSPGTQLNLITPMAAAGLGSAQLVNTVFSSGTISQAFACQRAIQTSTSRVSEAASTVTPSESSVVDDYEVPRIEPSVASPEPYRVLWRRSLGRPLGDSETSLSIIDASIRPSPLSKQK